MPAGRSSISAARPNSRSRSTSSAPRSPRWRRRSGWRRSSEAHARIAASVALFRVRPEFLERRIDEARLEYFGRRGGARQIAELHVELGGERLDFRIEAAIDAPEVFGVEIAHHALEESELEVGQPLVQDRGGLVGILHDEARAADPDVRHGLEGRGEL